MSKPRKARTGDGRHWGDGLAPADMVEVQRVVIEKAKAGNMQAAAIAERTWRRRQGGRLVRLDLPPIDDSSGLAAAQVAVIAAAARGEITPQEGAAFARMIDARRLALEAVEYEARLEEIETFNRERAKREAEHQQ